MSVGGQLLAGRESSCLYCIIAISDHLTIGFKSNSTYPGDSATIPLEGGLTLSAKSNA